MRVLVTGATGFIGANLVRLLLERGVEVRVVRRAKSPNLALEGLPLETVTAELTDPAGMAAAVKGCRQVYHLAGAFETGPGAAAQPRRPVHPRRLRRPGDLRLDEPLPGVLDEPVGHDAVLGL